MSLPQETLIPARWHMDAHGIPRSDLYGDRYHGAAGPLSQARAVFLHGCGLPQRWRARPQFTVVETGFGLGHNFLATWHAWRADSQRCARLHYLAFEAHPLQGAELAQAWAALPADVQPLADTLAHTWPALLPGVHQLQLDQGRLTLTLMFGSIRTMARQAQAQADAFFLDGFAPRVNPEMWVPAVFAQLRRIAARDATLATWCAAGQMRRDLRDAGFIVRKVPGFAGKREMTVAHLRPGLGSPPASPRPERIAVIGAGLAGANIAHALAQRGHSVAVWDALPAPTLAASDHGAAAALIPAITPDDDTRSRLSRSGLAHAHAQWMPLSGSARPLACGALLCATSAAHAQRQQHLLHRLRFPPSWIAWLDAAQASRLAGVPLAYGGLWLPESLRVNPVALRAGLLQHTNIQYHKGRIHRLSSRPAGGWQLHDDQNRGLDQAQQVVLANALEAGPVLGRMASLAPWPVLQRLKPLAGQVSLYPARASGAPQPACILSGHGYCLPPHQGWAVLGSTYRTGVQQAQADAEGHAAIREQLASWLDTRALPWLDPAQVRGWAGWRAATRDHLPLAGAVPGHPGVWLACGYGSRGLSWAALVGQWLAARLDGAPEPMERELLRRIRVR